MTASPDIDTELMVAVQRGDFQSFGLLVNRNRSVVVQYLARMVRNRAVAEELAQDVFIRVFRSRQNWEPTARFSTWLYRITTNVALNHFRDEKRFQNNVSLDFQEGSELRRETPDRNPLVEDLLLREVTGEQVRRAIRALPGKQRSVVILHKYHDLDYTQIGGMLGCSASAVKALMFRAYETLRVRLRGLEPLPLRRAA